MVGEFGPGSNLSGMTDAVNVPASPASLADSADPASSAAPNPVPELIPAIVADLAQDLAAARWTVDRVDEMLTPRALAALERDQRVPALLDLTESTDAADPAAVLTRLFVLGSQEPEDLVADALPIAGLDALTTLGLAAVEDGLVTALFDMRPHTATIPTPEQVDAALGGGGHEGVPDAPIAGGSDGPDGGSPIAGGPDGPDGPDAPDGGSPIAGGSDGPDGPDGPDEDAASVGDSGQDGAAEHNWWIVSDLAEAITGKPLSPDHVLGIGGATTTLLQLTMRHHVRTALDIGTGCGIQALYLATHADRVVATDLSERACRITAFNAALNGVEIDVRQGSLFEPVAGEQFDLIVSNPPFVITPDSVRHGGGGLMEYRDGGMERDHLIAAIVRGVEPHLTPGIGALQMLANWEIPAGLDPDSDDDWPTHPREWLDDTGLDAWVVQRDVLDPAAYAEMWMRDAGGNLWPRDQWEQTYADWLEDFDDAGVGNIGMGFMVLQRPGPATADGAQRGTSPRREYVRGAEGRAPSSIEVSRALQILTRPTQDLWDRVAMHAADVTEERHHIPGNPDPVAIVLRQGGGLQREMRVGSATAALVGASDGELTLGQIAAAIGALTDRPADDVRDETEPAIRALLEAGMLTIRDTTDAPTP